MTIVRNTWINISDETRREYIYPNGFVLGLDNPLELKITQSNTGNDSHEIKTTDQTGMYVAPGWVAVRWGVKENTPVFAE
jgi:hypothetical protein